MGDGGADPSPSSPKASGSGRAGRWLCRGITSHGREGQGMWDPRIWLGVLPFPNMESLARAETTLNKFLWDEMWNEILDHNLPSLEETVGLTFPGRTTLKAELIPSSGMSFGGSRNPWQPPATFQSCKWTLVWMEMELTGAGGALGRGITGSQLGKERSAHS